MSKKSVTSASMFPAVFDDFFRPWNEWFEGNQIWPRFSNMPAVNIVEEDDAFKVSLAVPGMKKEDFEIIEYLKTRQPQLYEELRRDSRGTLPQGEEVSH